MSDRGDFCIAVFQNTYAVLRAEKLLAERGIPVKLVPVPRQISSNCGLALRFPCERVEEARQAASPVADDLQGLLREGEAGYSPLT